MLLAMRAGRAGPFMASSSSSSATNTLYANATRRPIWYLRPRFTPAKLERKCCICSVAAKLKAKSTQTQTQTIRMKIESAEERGVKFRVGDTFYREESTTGRDLGVLAAALHKSKTGSLRVMDAMCASGVRSLRYLVHAAADFVWANDANESNRSTIVSNLDQLQKLQQQQEEQRWIVSHLDANRLLAERYVQGDLYDFIDIDSFGSDSFFLGSALSAAKYGGLLYLTSTDGFSSGGHRPHTALASYGSYIRRMPYCNEIGLRMLIGGALREAATRDMDVWPAFSYFSYHGPVFRVMLNVKRGRPQINRHYGFVSYCNLCGNSETFLWNDINKISCSFCQHKASGSLVVSGPLWIGPLHTRSVLVEMLELAQQWGWIQTENCSSVKENAHLKKVLELMIEESDVALPCGYMKLDEIASRGKVNAPRRQNLIDLLKKEGYSASRSHIATTVIKTNCSMTMCIKLVSVDQNVSLSAA